MRKAKRVVISRKRRALVGAFAAVVVGASVAACGSPDAESSGGARVSITDAQDRTVAVPLNPATVVATDWSAVRTLTALGIPVAGVPEPNGDLPDDLAPFAGDGTTKVGGLKEIDYEAISEIDPDLVVVGSRSGTPDVIAEMTKITPNVIDMSVRTSDPEAIVDEIRTRVTDLGSVFDRADRATELMDDAVGRMDDIRANVESTGRTAMFVQVSGNKVSAYGPGSRFGIIYSAFGFRPTDAPVQDGGTHGQEISQEFFTRYNPGALFVLDRGQAVGESEGAAALNVLDNGLVANTVAARDDMVTAVDGFSWYLATGDPVSLRQMSDDVAAALPDPR